VRKYAWPASFGVLIVGVASAFVARDAVAFDFPSLDGHATDPHHRLKFSEKDSLEERLGKIQSDTQVDVATWISDMPEQSLGDLGAEVYDRWHIGRDWENGVLLVFPSNGAVRVVLKPGRPALSDGDVARIVAEDARDPSATFVARIERAADEISAVLLVGAKAPKVRPRGQGDPRLGFQYAVGAAFVALLAVALSVVRRTRRSTSA
jgi:uncharacterized membrane protein YgcG